MPPAHHLQLDRVVFHGRPLSEYERFFQLDLSRLRGRSVLDCPFGFEFVQGWNELLVLHPVRRADRAPRNE